MLISICALFHVMNLKVIKWFDYLWMSQKNSDEDKSINCLPGIPLKKSSIKNYLKNMCMAIIFAVKVFHFNVGCFFPNSYLKPCLSCFPNSYSCERLSACPKVLWLSHLTPQSNLSKFLFFLFYIFKPKVCTQSPISPVRRCLCIIFAYQIWRCARLRGCRIVEL